jgi:hypothetical protein
MMKRSQYKGVDNISFFLRLPSSSFLSFLHPFQYRTQWSEVPADIVPRFGVERTIKLNALADAKQFSSDQDFKMYQRMISSSSSLFVRCCFRLASYSSISQRVLF